MIPCALLSVLVLPARGQRVIGVMRVDSTMY